jgi:hypothetical protein
MVVAAVVVGAWLLTIVAGLCWTVRRLHVGALDTQALVQKLAIPYPRSALDWPELRLRAVIPQPGEPALVLLAAQWPAHPERRSTLLLDLAVKDERSLALLSGWCAEQASVSPSRLGGDQVELRRRQSLDRVSGRLLSEDVTNDADTGTPQTKHGGSHLGVPGVD